LVLAALLAVQAGCGGSAGVEEEASTLKPLAVLYGQYLGQHRGQPPANEAEFKSYIEAQAAVLQQQYGLSDINSFFVSSRDDKPYVILYGPLTGPPGPGGQPVFAYEQQGVGGRRLVASSLGAVEEVDEATFKRLVPTAP
jgi:hypothetical protein